MREACVDTGRRAAIVPGEDQARRSCRIDSGLFAWPEAIDGPAVVVVVRKRTINLPREPVVHGQIGFNLPGILGVQVVLLRARVDEAAAALSVAVGNSQQEVGSRVAGGEHSTCAKAVRTVIFE